MVAVLIVPNVDDFSVFTALTGISLRPVLMIKASLIIIANIASVVYRAGMSDLIEKTILLCVQGAYKFQRLVTFEIIETCCRTTNSASGLNY